MPITEKQRRKRLKTIGSSDAAALLGVHPNRTAGDVYLEKTEQIPQRKPRPEMLAGRVFEDSILDWTQEELGSLVRNQRRVCPDAPLAANIDAILNQTGEPIEAKTAGLFGPLPEGWGEFGTDAVPSHVIVQCQVHLACLPKSHPDVCHVAAFLGGRGFGLYCVGRSDKLIDHIKRVSERFWKEYVEKQIPPPANEFAQASLELLKQRQRVPNKIIPVDEDLIAEWLSHRDSRLAYEKKEKAAQARILAELDDAEAGDCEAFVLTYYSQRSAPRVDVKRLKADGLYDKYVTQGEHRVLRVKQRKES